MLATESGLGAGDGKGRPALHRHVRVSIRTRAHPAAFHRLSRPLAGGAVAAVALIQCWSVIPRRASTMDERLVANRRNWDERTSIHLGSHFYDVEGWLSDQRGPRAWEREALGDVTGLRLLHLQSNERAARLAYSAG